MKIYKDYSDWFIRIDNQNRLVMYFYKNKQYLISDDFTPGFTFEKFYGYNYKDYDDWIHNLYRLGTPEYIPVEQYHNYWKNY